MLLGPVRVLHCVVLCCAAGVGGSRMHEVGMADSSLLHLTRREYVLHCNWKVFADNYLDGGYHVSLRLALGVCADCLFSNITFRHRPRQP